jgi:hypothetical protein
VARTSGQIEAAGPEALDAIEETDSRAQWRAAVRGLLPDLRPDIEEGIRDWYRDLLDTTVGFARQARRDVSLLRLEATYRYDIEPLVDLTRPPAQPEPDEEE